MKYELTHDTIAKQIFDKASTEARTRRKVERFVRERYEAWQQRGARLTQDDVDYVTPYLAQINISEEEEKFIAYARKQLATKRRNLRLLVIAIMAVLIGLTTWAVLNGRQAQTSEKRAQASAAEARKNADIAIAAKRQDSLKAIQLGIALDDAELATLEATVAKAADSLKAIELGIALNEANLQRLAAERRTREANALVLVAQAQQLPREAQSLAFKLAQEAWELTDNPLPQVQKLMADIYYRQREEPYLPLSDYEFFVDFVNTSSVYFSSDGRYTVHYSEIWNNEGEIVAKISAGYNFNIIDNYIFLPDGGYISAVGGIVLRWYGDGRTQEVIDLSEQGKVHFSPSGKLIVSIARRHTKGGSKLWSNEGELIATLIEPGEYVTKLLFSPDGTQVLTVTENNIVTIWNSMGERIHQLSTEDVVNDLEYAPDGTRIAISYENGNIVLYDSEGKLEQPIDKRDALSKSWLAFSPDGQYLIATHYEKGEKHVIIWSKEGKLLKVTADNEMIRHAWFSQDSRLLLTVHGKSEKIKVWSIDENSSAESILTLDTKDGVSQACFSPDKLSFLTVTKKKDRAQLWALDGGLTAEFAGLPGEITYSEFLADGQSIKLMSSEGIAVWDQGIELITSFENIAGEGSGGKFSPTGQEVLTWNIDEIKIWTSDGESINSISTARNGVQPPVYSPDGVHIAAASSMESKIYLWDSKGIPTGTIEGEEEWNINFEFSPDGQQILTYDYNDMQLRELDGTAIYQFSALDLPLEGVQFSPDGEYILATVSEESFGWTICFNNKGEEIAQTEGHDGLVQCTAFSPDSDYFVTGDEYRLAKLWTRDGKLKAELAGHTEAVVDVQFSADGEFIATASKDGIAKIWTADGAWCADLVGHQGGVLTVTFSPNGNYILTTGDDHTAKIWTLNGKTIANIQHQGYLIYAKFSPDGNQILTSSTDGKVRRWPMPKLIYQHIRDRSEHIHWLTDH